MPLQYKKYWLITITLTVLLAFAFQGTRGLWEPDEGRYVRCAYEMVTSGDWLTPKLNGNPHFSKPPLAYWLIASGLTLFGMNEWGARFFHSVAFFATALMAGYLAAKMWGSRTGILSVLVYVTMVFPFVGANIANTDMFLTCFETGAVLCLWMCVSRPNGTPQQALLWVLLMSLFLGLSFLTKGPPGLLPLLVGAAYLLVSTRGRKFSFSAIAAGAVVFAAIALPWYLLVIQKNSGLFSYFIKDEILGRIFTGEHSRNAGLLGPLKIYPHTLLLGALPWSCFWFKWGWESRAAVVTAAWWQQLRLRDNALFIAVWFLLPLFFLSVSRSRLPLYVLPLFVPLALASARALVLQYPALASSLASFRGKSAAYLLLFMLLLFGLRALTAYQSPKIDSRFIWQRISPIIQARVAGGRYELTVVELNLEGLTFYSGRMVENIEVESESTHSFFPVKGFSQKCAELRNINFTQVFLLSGKRFKKLSHELVKRGIPYSVEQGPFDYVLIFCQDAAARNANTNNAASQISESVPRFARAIPNN